MTKEEQTFDLVVIGTGTAASTTASETVMLDGALL